MPQGFVIIQIGNDELDKLCRDCIFPAIVAAGLEPRRVDRHNEGGLLKSEIIRFIQTSDILIADLTNERPNVYLEVGYAMGIDKFKNLILTTKEDHFPDSPNHRRGGPKVHFDLAGYDILRWSHNDLPYFREELERRIRRRLAVIAPGETIVQKVWDDEWLAQQQKIAVEGLRNSGRQGYMEARAAVHPPKLAKSQAELNSAARDSQIETFGWPIAVYLDRDEYRPRPKADGIYATVGGTGKGSFDYWAIRRNGDFYFLGSLFEDERTEQAIYFNTRIVRITEALLYCVRLYTRLGVDRSSTVSIAIRHGGLSGRSIKAVGNRHMFPRTTVEEVVDSGITATLDQIEAGLVDHVIALTAPLFQVFDFLAIDKKIYEEIVNSFVGGDVR